VYSLSKLFRPSLNRGKESTLVAMEKELLEHYLLLQKVRFKNKLEYEIHIDDSIMNYIIPKLILQPFVENSILHGIEGKEDGGTINISGCLKNDKLYFVIEDDGIGMDKEQIEKVEKMLEEKLNNEL
jgi:two-component system sensor histidine kinase YesM